MIACEREPGPRLLVLAIPPRHKGAAERLRAPAGDTLLIARERLWADSVPQLQGVQLGWSDQRRVGRTVDAEETITRVRARAHTHTHTHKKMLLVCLCVCVDNRWELRESLN